MQQRIVRRKWPSRLKAYGLDSIEPRVLAPVIPVTEATIYNWRAGRHKPQRRFQDRLRALGVLRQAR